MIITIIMYKKNYCQQNKEEKGVFALKKGMKKFVFANLWYINLIFSTRNKTTATRSAQKRTLKTN